MGNASKKLAAKCTLLSKDEQKVIADSFRRASRNSDRIREEELIKLWGPQMDPRLAQYINNYLFGFGANKSTTTDFQRFAELYVYNVRGTTDERLQLTFNSLGKDFSDDSNAELPYQLLKEYCESIASTYIKILKASASRKARAWIGKGFRGRPQHVQALGESLAAGLVGHDEQPLTLVNVGILGRGFDNDMLLKLLSELVFRHLYEVSKRQTTPEDSSPNVNLGPHLPHLLPSPHGLESMPDYPAFVDLSHIVWLNSHLPTEHQHKWRFLFSSHIHGESFSTMMGRIMDLGPSVIIIEDHSGHIFGGFASRSWLPGPNFSGSEESFLFSLAPRMRHYPASGYNDHFQYLNTHQKTMPNGLMMGGQFEYGGIWLDYEFGQGSSAESCSTYRNYKQLSKEKHFEIRSLEVWGVGDKPLSMKDSGVRDTSILDSNTEAKAILKLVGREEHSAGLREPAPL